MFNKKITVKLLSVLLAITLMFSVSTPLTASAIVAGEDTPQEFHYLTFDEMKNLSIEELGKYFSIAYQHEFPEEFNTVNQEYVDPNQIAPQWKSTNYPLDDNSTLESTHFFITFFSFAFIDNYYMNYFTKLPQDNDITYVVLYSERPDMASTCIDHFYNPSDGTNCFKYVVAPTAKGEFAALMDKAVNEMNSGKKESSMKTLGKAVHYIQDVCVPQHSNNASFNEKNHAEFEQWVADNFEKTNVTGRVDAIPSSKFNQVKTQTPADLLIAAAWSGYYDLDIASNTATFQQAANKTVSNAMIYTILAYQYFYLHTQ